MLEEGMSDRINWLVSGCLLRSFDSVVFDYIIFRSKVKTNCDCDLAFKIIKKLHKINFA